MAFNVLTHRIKRPEISPKTRRKYDNIREFLRMQCHTNDYVFIRWHALFRMTRLGENTFDIGTPCAFRKLEWTPKSAR